jgi:crotonobetainyl-CoA:carnitine CoA-transferase CaiB-like acyl-CoA transferase
VPAVTAPLDGIRVLDFTRVLAGPHATRMLCDLGADVVKIEPPSGDLTRFATPKVNGLSTYFVQQNAGKRNVSIDLAVPAGAALAAELAARCDVVVENYRPGVMARLGLDHATLRSRQPRLVYASITGYGSSGPWTDRRAYAPVVGAEAGITKAQGDARGAAYTNDPFSHADVYTALETVAAILAALYRRERTGEGSWIDVSMAQSMLYVNEHLHDQLYDGDVDPGWIRSFAPGDYLVVETANGDLVTISGHPAERGTFELFVAAFGLDGLAASPGFETVVERLANLAELRERIAAVAAEFADAAALEERLAQHGLAAGKVRDARELAESAWAGERDAIASVSDRGDGAIRIPNPPWRFDGAPGTITGEPRYRGEDNRVVLAELLGYDDDRIAELEAAGVLSSRLPSPR